MRHKTDPTALPSTGLLYTTAFRLRDFLPSVPLIFLVPAPTLPGLPSTLPITFSTAPSTLSLMLGLRLCWVAGARFLVMPPAVERGLDVFALVFLVVARLRDGSAEMAATTRGLELPVVLRVEAILDS